jgi:hypothetical protein
MDDLSWLDDYCQQWQYDNDLINLANEELNTIKENEDAIIR